MSDSTRRPASSAHPARAVPVAHHRPPVRRFDVMVGTERLISHEGPGLEPAAVLAEVLRAWPRRAPDEAEADDEDQVVLEGRKVVAVVRAMPDGSPAVAFVAGD